MAKELKRANASSDSVRDMLLPTEPTQPKIGLTDFKWMIHGFPKTGKTTLASYFPNAMFCFTEEGGVGFKRYETHPKNWREVCKVAENIINEDHNFDVLVVDTIEQLYVYLTEHVANEAGVSHVSELGFGAGWQEANKRLHKLLELLSERVGVVLISHSRYEEEKKGTRTITKIVPDLSKSPRGVVTGWVDLSVYLSIEEGDEEDEKEGLISKHVAICQPTPYIEAGGRLQLPGRVSLGSSPKEGFKNLKNAFEEAKENFLNSL